MGSRGSAGWLALGVVLMVASSVWAPPQPELITGGACQSAPCGTLEDPERWRRAWWIWLVGASVALPAAAVVARARPAPRWPTLLLVVAAPVVVLVSAFLAVLVALFTSVQGAATTMVVAVLLPGVAMVSSWLKRPRARPERPRC